MNAAGVTLAQNRYSYAAYPQSPPDTGMTVAIHDPLNQLQYLRLAFAAHGVAVIDENAAATHEKAVWLSSVLDDATKARLSQGAAVVLLAGSRDALPVGGTLTILPRAGSDLTGDWVSNFNWVLSSSPLWKPLSPVIDDSILGWEAASVTPDFVIAGLRAEDSQNVLAGVFYGWLNSNRAYLAELSEGPGRMFLTTFRFQGYGQDPFATVLLRSNTQNGGCSGPAYDLEPVINRGAKRVQAGTKLTMGSTKDLAAPSFAAGEPACVAPHRAA